MLNMLLQLVALNLFVILQRLFMLLKENMAFECKITFRLGAHFTN